MQSFDMEWPPVHLFRVASPSPIDNAFNFPGLGCSRDPTKPVLSLKLLTHCREIRTKTRSPQAQWNLIFQITNEI
jgi:hypothetical protein